MAYYCPDCKRVFDNRRALCSKCGYPTLVDDRPDRVYIDMGYSPCASAERKTDDLPPVAADNRKTVRIDDADLIDQLRAGFGSSGGSQSAGTGEAPAQPKSGTAKPKTPRQERVDAPEDDFFGAYGTQRTEPQTARTTEPTQAASANDDFFGAYGTGSQTGTSNPRTTEPTQAASTEDDFFGNYGTNHPRTPSTPTSGSTNRQQPHERRDYRVPRSGGNEVRRFFRGTGNTLSAIPWRLILWLAVIAFVGVGLYSLWQMREEILSGILNFVTSLIPAALVIGGIVWVVRKLFRR